MEDMHILVVDDRDYNRAALIGGLINHGARRKEIFEAGSGEEAEELVRLKPAFFDVAVIDQKLKAGAIDGIETTRRICSHERDIFPIIFTNIPSDDPAVIEAHRARAYEAGAYRYMYKEGASDDIIKVKDFVTEIRQLRQLKQRIHRFYEVQQYTPSLLTQLDIMVALIDRGFKVWYLNAANRRFQDLRDLPRSACSGAFLKFKGPPPCSGCIVQQTFLDGKEHERIYLHPMEGSLQKMKWVYSWTQPMPDENGGPILLEDGKPIAVLESSQDLTGSSRLRTMPLDEKMHHIVRALHERPDGFDRVRIYEANPEGSRLKLINHMGYPRELDSALIEVADFSNIRKSIKHFKKTGEGLFHKVRDNIDPIFPGEYLERFIHWPLMKGERLVGLVSVSAARGGRPCGEDGIDIVKVYAEEALKAFELKDKGATIPEIEKIASHIDNLLIREGTPETKLQTLVDEVYRITTSDSVNIRYREENIARLLPIGKGRYFESAPRELHFSKRDNPAVRVIVSGRGELHGSAASDPEVLKYRQTLPAKAGEALENTDSYCFEPLIFQNRCIGTLALYKKEKNHYDEKLIAAARVIANRMALALHDYLVNRERMIKDYAFESSINAIAFADLDGNVNYVNPSFLKLWGYTNEKEVLGKNMGIFWQYRNKTLNVLETLRSKGSWRGELAAKRKNGSVFDVQLSSNLVKDKMGKTIGTMASFIDVTRRKRLEKVQKSIYRISETAGSVQKLDELYPKIHEIISGLIPAGNFYIALYDEKNRVIDFPYFVDEKDPPPPPKKVGKGITEYVLRTGKPLLAHREVYQMLAENGEIELFGTPSLYWLGVPLKTTANTTIGVLVVQTYKEGSRYTEKDKDMLVFVSTQIAMAIQRKQAEDRLIASLEEKDALLKEKEALLKEIHHRVKNNLAIISELLYFQSGLYEDPQFSRVFQSSRDRIKSMALIHETLYQSHDFAKIGSAGYIDNLVEHLTSAYGSGENSIRLEVQTDNIPLDIDTAIPCGLIINELVTNAFKHAYPTGRGGKITIVFRVGDHNRVTLMVGDNGPGLSRDLDIENTTSIGLRLVDILVRQLEAAITIERNGGTRFIITFEQKDR